MKETKFTPKPWRRDDRDWGDKWQIRGMANGAKAHDVPHKCDAVICSVNNNLLEADANANLLAVAPEFYEFVGFFTTFAGQILLKKLGKEGREIYDEAVRLCDKARGEVNSNG